MRKEYKNLIEKQLERIKTANQNEFNEEIYNDIYDEIGFIKSYLSEEIYDEENHINYLKDKIEEIKDSINKKQYDYDTLNDFLFDLEQAIFDEGNDEDLSNFESINYGNDGED